MCDWNVDGMWCKYPGSVCNDTKGEGRRYCRFHARTDDIHEGRAIVLMSQSYRPENYAETYAKGLYPEGDTAAVAEIRANLKPNPPAPALKTLGPRGQES